LLSVLIVEDDLMIADLLESALLTHHYRVCGIATTVTEAVTLALREKPDLAIIDLRLADGGLGSDIPAQIADKRGLGILYATGNAANVVLTSVHGHACISKPYNTAGLLRALSLVIEIAATGQASLPHPKGFRVLMPPPSERASHG
jgi:DNA-binding response OmpR family regulator